MKVFVSNKLEKLSQCLAEQLNMPLENPLAEEIIIVQSVGMAKWVLLELARRQGIAANYRFPFPKKYLEEIFKAFLPGYTPDLSFDEQVMTWKILELLPQVIEDDDFLPLRHYLGDERDQRKMYQLAGKIASTFDQYLIFRPEMILGWEEGTVKDSREIWQSKLWKMIVAAQGAMHQARLRRLFLSAAKNRPFCQEVLPQRLSIFGISYLPPYYGDIFSMLSEHLPVYYYYLNPSQEFWADIRSRREIGFTLEKAASHLSDMNDELLHLESGNSLLASWGSQGRDFFRMMGDISVEYADLFEEPAATSLLAAIQSDICLLKEPGAEDESIASLPPEDDSLQIHSCHSPLREVETLHDLLLKLFEKNDRLTPQDILVMTPDIELYAPYIEAVFEAREPKIPYAITDRGQFSASVAGHGVMALLDLAAGRFTAADVLSVLDNAAISEKYGLTAACRELIRHWVSKTHIKWGIDAAHRQSYNLPPFEQNTWRHGLARLLAGYALDGRRQELFADILPYGEIESQQAETLGCFLNFWEDVLRLRDILLAPHPLDDWCVILQNIFTDFLSSSDMYRHELSALRQVVNEIEAKRRAAKFTGRIELDILKSYLQEALAGGPAESAQFLAGGVSFCALLPMRSIPFAVICLMGMGNEAFPRRDRKIGFNIMETNPRAGDRLQRNDDRYLFLEALLAARENLVISYVGQSETDNGEILPSVLVCELLDYIDKNYRGAQDRFLPQAFTLKHRLHSFSPAYFGYEQNLFSYSKQNYQAACAILNRHEENMDFAQEVLPALPEWSRTLAISDLLLFYRHPSRYFLENRLYLRLPQTSRTEEDSEPFTIDSLSRYRIKQSLVESHLAAAGAEMVWRRERSGGVLPVGGAGDYAFQLLSSQARNYAVALEKYIKGQEPEKYNIDLPVGDCRLMGALDNLYKNYRVQYRMSRLKTNDYFSAWISHLIQNAAPGEIYPKTSLLLGEDGSWKFKPVDNAQEILEVLVRYYRLGQTKPLKFFGRASWEYAQALWLKNKSSEEAIRSAKLAWLGNDSARMEAEASDPACKICFENVVPIDDEFAETAANLLQKLCLHLEKPE